VGGFEEGEDRLTAEGSLFVRNGRNNTQDWEVGLMGLIKRIQSWERMEVPRASEFLEGVTLCWWW
jgi:hypothetical protein